jgi:hypothetical protein
MLPGSARRHTPIVYPGGIGRRRNGHCRRVALHPVQRRRCLPRPRPDASARPSSSRDGQPKLPLCSLVRSETAGRIHFCSAEIQSAKYNGVAPELHRSPWFVRRGRARATSMQDTSILLLSFSELLFSSPAGNRVIFSLSSASPYLEDAKTANFYGFKCLVIGHEHPVTSDSTPGGPRQSKESLWTDGLLALERELAYLAGLCCASVIDKTLELPPSGRGQYFMGEHSTYCLIMIWTCIR